MNVFVLESDMVLSYVAQEQGIKPDQITYTQLIDGCGQCHRMELAPTVLKAGQFPVSGL